MDYKRWLFFYRKILDDFGYSEEEDREAALVLNDFLEKDRVDEAYQHLKKLLENKEVFVCGAGPSLASKIKRHKKRLSERIIIAADGATSTLISNDLIPHVIVTDLDGNVVDQVEANKRGSVVVVHAHGDNKEAIKKWIRLFEGRVLGTTQSKPDKNLYNFGGFTDGDRAAFLAEHFGAKTIFLIGFDFDAFPKKKDAIKKRKKLGWCKILLEEIKGCELIFL
jgi:hypothetical protein